MKTVKLGEIADLTVGFVGSMTEQYTESGVSFLRSLNIKPFEISSEDIRFISEEFNTKISKSILHEGDVVIVRTGIPGTCAVVPKEYDGCNCSDIVIVHPNNELVDSTYLAGFINFWGQKQVENNKVGAIQKHFNVHTAEEMLITLPEIDVQRKIAMLLNGINGKIKNNQKINDNLYKSAETKYNYWFNQLNDSLPAGWIRKSVHELLTVTTGREDANFSTDNGIYPFFTCSSDTLCCDTPAFEGHAILIAGNGDFNVKHYTGKFNAYQRTYVLIPNESIYYGAIYFAASQSIRKFKAGSNGSIVKFITKGDVENISIVIPDKNGYFEELNQYLISIEANNQEINTLTSLRNWLLPLLMNGQATIAD